MYNRITAEYLKSCKSTFFKHFSIFKKWPNTGIGFCEVMSFPSLEVFQNLLLTLRGCG